ncbi:hypothetical protein QQ008_07330 [Fulvivirgaceae bacterium BMA10]|uniref:Uncharacterized protein n=1 Tax=Splendidivirga corallicola TaxID=3051826 RepID=A0ABT8KKC7_9BACT|nr:hypothetical protein [Fulvivirgaceae bacterium BMA10]
MIILLLRVHPEVEQIMMKFIAMMNKLLLIITSLFILSTGITTGQVLNQDAKGESSIVYPGSIVYFNASEAQLGFAYNNLPRTILKKQGPLLGISMKGETKTGTFNFLKEGEFVPSGKISGILGFYSNFDQSAGEVAASNDSKKFGRDFRSGWVKTLQELESGFDKAIDNSSIASIGEKDKLKKGFKEFVKELDFPPTVQLMKEKFETKYALFFVAKKDKEVIKALGSFSPLTNNHPQPSQADKIIDKHYSAAEKAWTKMETNYQTINKERNKTILGFSLYLAGGLEATGYKLIDTLKFQDDPFGSIKKESFTSTELLVGGNLNVGGSWVFGLALGGAKIFNFGSLPKSEFSLKREIKFASGTSPDTLHTIERKKDIIAYQTKTKGNNHFLLKVDVVYYYPTGNGNVAINPYLRFQSPTNGNNQNLFTNVTDLGIGTYFNNKKGKFQGGLYLQFNDIKDNRSKLKMDDSSLDFDQRISFGILTKFSIGSVFQRLTTN